MKSGTENGKRKKQKELEEEEVAGEERTEAGQEWMKVMAT